MVYEITEIFGNMVDTSSIYIISNALFVRKEKTKNLYIITAIFLQSIGMRFLNILFSNSHWIVLAMLVLSSYLICRVFFYVKGLKFIYSIAVFFVIVALIELIVTISITKIFNIDNILLQQNNYRMLGIITSKIITLYIVIYFSRLFKTHQFKLEKYGILTLIMMILSLIVFFIATGIYENIPQFKIQIIYIMIIASIMAVISILMLFIVRKIIDITEENTRFITVKREYEKNIQYLKKFEELKDEIKSKRHDYKNHLISLSSIAKNKKTHNIVEYIDEILEIENKTDSILKIENKIVSALINYNMDKMENNNINFQHDITLPEKLHVSDVDLSIIIGNLLDNAVEACQKIEKEERYINLRISYGYGKIDIIMKNSSINKIDIVSNHIDTTKLNKKNHGHGLENIKKTVEKYNGYFKIYNLNNEFITEILL
jgi:signal transduction histidine kinase